MAYFIEIYESDESALLATMRAGAGSTEDIISIDVEGEVNGSQTLTLKVARSKVTPANLSLGNIVRLIDDYKTNDPYTTYRIKTVNENQENSKKAYITCVCEHLKYDLMDIVVTESRQFIQTTANDILDYILDEFASDWSRNLVINGTTLYDYNLEFGETVYDCIKRLSATMQLETLFHADGTDLGHDGDWKQIDICIVNNTFNGTPGNLVLDTTENVKTVKYDRDVRDSFATRVYPSGGGCNLNARRDLPSNKTLMTVQLAEFTVKSYSSGVITFYSKNLLIADDALNNYELYCFGPTGVIAGIPITISDSAKTSSGDTVTTSPGAWSTPPDEGDIIVFYDGLRGIDFVPNSGLESTYWNIATSYKDSAFEDYINYAGPVGRSDMSNFNTGLVTGWTKIGTPTCTEDTTAGYIINGSSTQKVIAAEDEGIYRALELGEVTGAKFQMSFWVWVTVTALDADTVLDMRLRYDTDSIAPDTNGLYIQSVGTEPERIIGTTSSAPQRVLVGGLEVEKIAGYDPRLEIVAVGGGATFYVDSVCVVKHPIPLGRDKFVLGDSRAVLWEESVIDYGQRISLTQEYSAEVFDIYHNAPTTNSDYEFKEGDSCTLTVPALDIDTTVRILKKSFKAFEPILTCRVSIDATTAGKSIKAAQSTSDRTQRSGQSNDYLNSVQAKESQSGFESVIVEDENKNVSDSGKSVTPGLVNGVWTVKNNKGQTRPTYHQ